MKRDILCKWLIEIHFSVNHFCLSLHNCTCLTELTQFISNWFFFPVTVFESVSLNPCCNSVVNEYRLQGGSVRYWFTLLMILNEQEKEYNVGSLCIKLSKHRTREHLAGGRNYPVCCKMFWLVGLILKRKKKSCVLDSSRLSLCALSSWHFHNSFWPFPNCTIYLILIFWWSSAAGIRLVTRRW